jgi:hypothetical protein
MDKLKSIFALLLVAAIAFSTPAFASVGIQDDGENKNQAATINFGTGLTVTGSGPTKTVTAANGDTTGNLTFQTTLTAGGRAGGASTMSSSSTFLSAAGIAYAVINKRIGGNSSGTGLDATGRGSEMVAGKNGQRLTFLITACRSSDFWNLTAMGHGWNWNLIKFDTVDDYVSMDYITGLGWILDSFAGVTITRNQLP